MAREAKKPAKKKTAKKATGTRGGPGTKKKTKKDTDVASLAKRRFWTMFNSKIDIYRIVDGLHKIDVGLYELLNATNISTKYSLRSKRFQIIGPGAIVVALLLAAMPLVVAVAEVEWNSAPVIIIGLVAIAYLICMLLQVKSTSKAIEEMNALISSVDTAALDLQTYYSIDQVSEWGTRLSLAQEVLKENEQLHSSKEIAQKEYRETKSKFEKVKSHCISRLKEIEILNEKLHKKGTREEKEYKDVADWLETYKKFF